MSNFLKGIIVGLGKIIPGVSGSVLAISLGIYEDSIYAINNLFKNTKDSIIFLFPIATGIFISIIFFSKLIIIMLNSYYVPSILFFLGLIIGGSKEIIKEIKIKYLPLTLLCTIILLSIELLPNFSNLYFSNNILFFAYYFIIGIIDAITMIIPGISGTAVLMILGCYNTLINAVSRVFDINNVYSNLSIIIPFIIGIIFGIFILTKIINKLLNSYYHITYNAILGFLVATIIYMFKTTLKSNYNMFQVIIGFIFFILGFLVTKRINFN